MIASGIVFAGFAYSIYFLTTSIGHYIETTGDTE